MRLVVNYDSNNGWSSLIDNLKKATQITNEVEIALLKLKDIDIENITTAKALGQQTGYTNEEFFNFAKQADLSGDVIQQYKDYMNQASSSTAKFSSSLKTLSANIGIILAINVAIKAAAKLWDTLNVTVEEQTEKINGLKLSFETLQSEYDKLSQKQDITDAEKHRLEYLERRLELDERILKAEQAQLFEEKTGNKFTDLFDKDNLNTQYLAERNIKNKEGFNFQSRAYEYDNKHIQIINEELREWEELQKAVEKGSEEWLFYQNQIDTLTKMESDHIDSLSKQENQLTVNLRKYADNIEFLQSQLDTGELTEDQTATAKEQLDIWQNLYDETDAMITQIQKLNGTYDYTAENISKKYAGELEKAKVKLGGYIYDDRGHGSLNESGKAVQDFWNESVLSGTEEEIAQNVKLWNKVTAEITDATKAIEAYTEAKKNADTADTFPTSLSITETVNQINTQLKPAFDSLKSAYQNIFSLDEYTGEQRFSLEGVGIETFEQIRAELEKLDGIDGINVDYSAFENFVSVLNDTSSTADQVQEQFDNLATSMIYTTDCTNMSVETYDLLVQSLTEMGITNAEEVLNNLKDIQEELVRAGYDVANITAEEVVRLIELEQVSAETAEYLKFYLLQKELAQNPLNTFSDILALEQLCNTLGLTAEMLGYVDALRRAFNAQELGATGIEPTIANLKSKIASLANGQGEFQFNFSVPKVSGSSSGSGSSSNSSKTEKGTTKEYDWIEQAIESVEKEIKELDETASSSYSTLSQKNEALTAQIGKVTEEIELQQKAYEEYMRKADSIGLPDNYKELVQNGSINIEDIKDEKLQDQIDGYQKWYEKARKASDAINDLKTDLKDLHVESYKLQTDDLKSRLDSDSITEKQYLAGLKSAYEKYYANLTDYAQQYHEAVLEYLEEEKKYLNSVANAAASLVDTEIKRIQDITEEQEEQIQSQIELLEDRKKPLQDELDALDEKVRKEELALNLQKAQYDLAKAENQRTKLVYTADKGMIYTSDPKAIREAQKNVEDAKSELHKQSIQDQIGALDDEIDRYNDLIDQINKAANAQVKALEKIKNKWQEVIDLQEYAENVAILTGEFGSDAIVKILTGNDDDLLARWKENYISTLKSIDMESQGYIGEMTKQIESLYKNSANVLSNAAMGIVEPVNAKTTKNTAQNNINTIDKPVVAADGHVLLPIEPGNPAWDLLQKCQPLVDKILSGEMDIISNAVFEHQKQMANRTKNINSSHIVNNIANNRNIQPVTLQMGDIILQGIQDVNGLAQAIKTRFPNAMLQESHKK